jgi:hypothetical protein
MRAGINNYVKFQQNNTRFSQSATSVVAASLRLSIALGKILTPGFVL